MTLACEGQTCKAHKMVLSACSPYFKSLLEVNYVKNKNKTTNKQSNNYAFATFQIILMALCVFSNCLLCLQENPSKHPIIILKDVSYSHLQAILEFMYAGEVNVSQEQLPAFLKTADRLKVKGLAETPSSIKRE